MNYKVWESDYKLDKIKLTVRGFSVASRHTGFYIPELKLCFDAGVCMPYNPEYICISHCHADHSSMLPLILTAITSKPKILVPASDCSKFQQYINSYRELAYGDAFNAGEVWLPINDNEVTPLTGGYKIQAVSLYHSVPTTGYILIHSRKRLKEMYSSKSSKECAELSKSGTELSESYDTPLLAYLCDTTTEIYSTQKIIKILENKIPYIICECTFIDATTIELAKSSKHTHWNDLKDVIKKYPDTQFILTHFSARYTQDYITTFFNGENINNVYVWVNSV